MVIYSLKEWQDEVTEFTYFYYSAKEKKAFALRINIQDAYCAEADEITPPHPLK